MTFPRLYCITGADGSGKSTACARARARIDERWGAGACREVSVWDGLLAQRTAQGIEVTPAFRTRDDASRYLADLDGPSRTLFILHSMSRALQLGMRDPSARVLLLNGYWYKYAVSELGYGVPSSVVLGAAEGFPAPRMTFCLDLSPETAWSRRQAATRYEQGPGEGGDEGSAGVSTRDRFIDFQRRLRESWALIEDRVSAPGSGAHAGPWIHLSAELAPESLVDRIVTAITADLRASMQAEAERVDP